VKFEGEGGEGGEKVCFFPVSHSESQKKKKKKKKKKIDRKKKKKKG
jgi:hypothetical protein